MIGQRQKIYCVLREADHYLSTMDVVHACRRTTDSVINNINPRPANRCLNELLSQGKVVKKYVGDNPYWLGLT